jgi:hypothetical protein
MACAWEDSAEENIWTQEDGSDRRRVKMNEWGISYMLPSRDTGREVKSCSACGGDTRLYNPTVGKTSTEEAVRWTRPKWMDNIKVDVKWTPCESVD